MSIHFILYVVHQFNICIKWGESLLIKMSNLYFVVIIALITVVAITLILEKPELGELDVRFKFLGFEFKTKATYKNHQK